MLLAPDRPRIVFQHPTFDIDPPVPYAEPSIDRARILGYLNPPVPRSLLKSGTPAANLQHESEEVADPPPELGRWRSRDQACSGRSNDKFHESRPIPMVVMVRLTRIPAHQWRPHMSKCSQPIQKLLTVAEVAERFSLSTKSIYRRINDGELRVHKIGRALRISEHDFASYAAAQRH